MLLEKLLEKLLLLWDSDRKAPASQGEQVHPPLTGTSCTVYSIRSHKPTEKDSHKAIFPWLIKREIREEHKDDVGGSVPTSSPRQQRQLELQFEARSTEVSLVWSVSLGFESHAETTACRRELHLLSIRSKRYVPQTNCGWRRNDWRVQKLYDTGFTTGGVGLFPDNHPEDRQLNNYIYLCYSSLSAVGVCDLWF